ncbi:hypothetical protein [Pacificibacter marinus]|uniref:hypothetical protein n=1 Tax=Pacificibacter marinus TaxID=658057 RepID=UPI001C066649|nr:hypothetical protein [Pacificibacter marinus]MBU2865743.1 hypothetical protein [Pacificibacter marinus]
MSAPTGGVVEVLQVLSSRIIDADQIAGPIFIVTRAWFAGRLKFILDLDLSRFCAKACAGMSSPMKDLVRY